MDEELGEIEYGYVSTSRRPGFKAAFKVHVYYVHVLARQTSPTPVLAFT